MTPRKRTLVAGRFELEEVAGRGAIGDVYRAVDRGTGTAVAIKLLRRHVNQERFVREVRTLRQLEHPHVVRYVTHGLTEEGVPFVACEWLEGEMLDARLARAPLGVDEVIHLARGVASALGAGHAHGIVHRDLKPGNLMLVGGLARSVKVLDFGLARRPGIDPRLTETGAIVGTPSYMSPEQARGEVDFGPPADVFALGCVLFTALAGRPPFVAEDTLGILMKVVLEDAPRLGTLAMVPELLEEIVSRMLAKAPGDRYADGDAVAAALATLGESLGTSTAGDEAIGRADRLTMKERRIASIVVAARSSVSGGALEPAVATELEALCVRLDARLEVLADRSIVIVLEGRGTFAPTDRAAQAARCALAIEPLVHPDGLAVVSGQMATHAPVGQLVDSAVALLSTAQPGTIRVDEATAGLIARELSVEVDGSGAMLRVDRDAQATLLLGRPTPFLGRAMDLGFLAELFDECAEERASRAVIVTGAPGVGKSRLARELLDRVRQPGPVAIWRARGEPIGASPMSLVAQIVRNAIGATDGESLELRRYKLRSRLSRRLSGDDLARVTEFVGEAIGTPFEEAGRVELAVARRDPAVMRDQVRRAWEDFLSAECGRWPVVLVLEDLQWGDLASVKLVDAALRNLRAAPLFVLALGRPELDQRVPDLWENRNVQRLRLRPLSRAASAELARVALGAGASDASIERIAELSHGNGFYLEELVRAVAGGSDELPPTVVAMAQARLGAFHEDDRRVLRAASVFGGAFSAAGVAALLGGPTGERAVHASLERLKEREVVVSRPPSGHGFRHALLREAAYAALTDEDRALGHRLAAVWLEAGGGGHPVELAEHFERGQEPERAISWYSRAAQRALDGNDLEAAVAWAERGVRCGAAGEMLGGLRLVQAEARVWSGPSEELERAARAAMDALPRAGGMWFRAAGCLLVSEGRLGLQDRVVETARELIDLARGCETTQEAAIAMSRTAVGLCYDAGRYDMAAEAIATATALARALPPDPRVSGWLARAGASHALCTGDSAAFLDLAEQAVESFTTAGDFRVACVHRSLAGFGWLEVGAPERAEVILRDALSAGARLGAATVETAAKQNLGLALARLGRFDEAIAMERDAIEACIAAGDRRMEGGCRTYLAIAFGAAGRHDLAAEEAEKATTVLEAAAPLLAYALATHARAELARGRGREALDLARRGAKVLESAGTIEEGEAAVHLAHAEALLACGDTEGARGVITTAERRLRERADRIASPSTRRTFLEDVPDNARTRLLAASLGAGELMHASRARRDG